MKFPATYKLRDILDQEAKQQCLDGQWIPARFLLFNDGKFWTRLRGAWAVLTGRAYPVEWD